MNAQTATTATTATTAPTIGEIAINMLSFAKGSEALADLKLKQDELRTALVTALKEHKSTEWKTIKGDVKAALVEAQTPGLDGVLGVLKTSFEYRIIPTCLNAARLRAAPTWTSWSGATIKNTYVKVKSNAPTEPDAPDTPETAPETAPTIDTTNNNKSPKEVLLAIKEQLEANRAAAALAKPAPIANANAPSTPATTIANANAQAPQKPAVANAIVPPSEIKALRVNAEGQDELSPFEHWQGLAKQFLGHGVTVHYTRTLAALLDIDAGTLARAMVQAQADLTAKADTLKK